MNAETSPAELIEGLEPDAIRQRLAELDAEQSALRVFLRAALARSRSRDRKPKDSGGKGRTCEK